MKLNIQNVVLKLLFITFSQIFSAVNTINNKACDCQFFNLGLRAPCVWPDENASILLDLVLVILKILLFKMFLFNPFDNLPVC